MHKNDKVIELEKKIVEARNEYYNTGNGLVSDDVYDLWIETLKKIDPENILIAQVGAEPVSEWLKEPLPIPMGSLNKVQDPEQFMDWFNKYDKKCSYVAMDKLDGLSICVEYRNGKFTKALTRGANDAGENISSNVIKMGGIKKDLKVDFTGYLRGEIILTKENHKKYFADYSNPRNAASGISRRYDGTGAEHLDVMFYNVISDIDFTLMSDMLSFIRDKLELYAPVFVKYDTAEDIIKYWHEYQDHIRESLPYEIDGMVLAIDDIEYQMSLGETNSRLHGQTAFKFIPELKETTLIGLQWQNGNSNRITPVAILEPVSIAGTTVQRASLHNCANIKRLGVTIGATVAISKRNEIIPQIEAVILKTDKEIEIPKTCPVCNTPTEMNGEYLICPNITTCPSQQSGRLRNWTNALNLLEYGTVLADNLVEYGGIKTVVDLYKLSIEDLEKLPRMGTKSATRAYDILHSHMEVKLESFFGGLSLPMVGETIIRLIMDADYNSIDKIMSMSINDFENIAGIGPVKARALYSGLIANKDIIKGLLDVGITIKEKTMGKLNGMSFCITGQLSKPREEFKALIEENGGTWKSSVGKSLSYLIMEDPSLETVKAKTAKKNGTKCISEQELLAMIDP